MGENPIEERIYERLNLPIRVNYEVSTRPRYIRQAVSRNIGGGGLCLSLPEKLTANVLLNIYINIPELRPESYDIRARVVWTRIIEVTADGGSSVYYDTGIQFLKANPVVIGEIMTHFYSSKI